jgi:hypothetical protein
MLAEATTTAQTTRTEVLSALHQASAATGSDFDYLLGTAMRESSLKPQAKSASSSAAGLFQFVSQTWLGMVKTYGAKYGLGSYADAITKGAGGHYHADNSADRQAILALRTDPKISALMAGEYAKETKDHLQSQLGREVGSGELYAAHFLGAGGACKLIEMKDRQPGASAAQCFPAAAEANRSVFFNHDGSAKTVSQVYDWAVRQPRVPHKVLAEAEVIANSGAANATALSFASNAFASNSLASSLLSQPASGSGHDLSALSLFTDVPASGETASLLGTSLPSAPFVLTPGVVDLLASLTPGNGQEDGSQEDGDQSENPNKIG